MPSSQSDCEHEWEPFPEGQIVISDEEFWAAPFKSFAPESIVPCLKCGAPIDRGRYPFYISIPALRDERSVGLLRDAFEGDSER